MFGSDELNYYEWIPWEGLSNIKEIAKGGFGIIYKATLIDGLIDLESIKHHGSMEYKRWGKREVAIKIIKTNSSEVFKEFCPMLLWELATGKPPFHDFSHDHFLIMAILNGQRPKITSPLIPPSIAKIIKKCWDVNPENCPTAREVGAEGDDSTIKPLGIFLQYIQIFKKTKKRDEIAKPSTDCSRVIIHPGAVYTSRLLTAQMIDLSTGLFIYFKQ
ncbi:hypothetical protein G9A89_009127 [Geosiphon pyriformis]|nr:hypothetical protein G9A89_009127 [Geosiphon pyriformis]